MLSTKLISRQPIQGVVARRSVSTLIPPRVASPNAAMAKEEPRYRRIERLYASLPKGKAPPASPKGLIERYTHRYFATGKESIMPVVHVVGALLIIGYAQEYYFHLRHHKSNAH